VDTYTDPIRALSEFKANYYYMIILDYRMDGLNGLELCQKIRAGDKSARAMLLTAGHEQSELDENYKWFLRVVGKPIHATTLLEFVLDQTNSLPDILTRQDYLFFPFVIYFLFSCERVAPVCCSKI
jgi:Response regulators consisting of a CheY-like receiver domain and a winged-helix DNA-binding domain